MDAATTSVFLAIAVSSADSSAAELGYSAAVAWQSGLPITYGVGRSGSEVFGFCVTRLPRRNRKSRFWEIRWVGSYYFEEKVRKPHIATNQNHIVT